MLRLLQIQGDGPPSLYIDSAGNGKRGFCVNYTYILRCSDGTYYTGWTNHLKKRVDVHNSGCGAKYTRGRTPVELVYFEEFQTKEEAMSREAAIKKLTRKEKEKLVESRPVLQGT